MKNILAFLILFLSCFSQAQTKAVKNPPYVMKNFKYDKVIAYECINKRPGYVLVKNDYTIDTSLIKKQTQLSTKQIDSLNLFLLGSEVTEKKITTNCLSPYLTVVYYLNNQVVADFNIAADCDLYIFYFRSLEHPNDWPNTKRLYTKKQLLRLNNLCAELGLKYY